MPPKSLTLLREKTEWIHYTAQKAMCYWGALSQQELTHTTESGKAEQSRLQETQAVKQSGGASRSWRKNEYCIPWG